MLLQVSLPLSYVPKTSGVYLPFSKGGQHLSLLACDTGHITVLFFYQHLDFRAFSSGLISWRMSKQGGIVWPSDRGSQALGKLGLVWGLSGPAF